MFQGRFKSVAVSREEWALELSRYVHLSPVRVQALGSRKEDRMGLSTPNAEVVRQRLAVLRGYRWSSYRAYAGLGLVPEWLECRRVLSLGREPGKRERRRLLNR